MRKIFLFIATLLTLWNLGYGQTRTIQGRVIAEDDLGSIPGVLIETAEQHQVARSDIEGRFKIDIPKDAKKLIFRFIGYEKAIITLSSDCDTVEIVMLSSGSYDFMSSRKIDKDRLKRFRRLPMLRLQAYQKGIFSKPSACYSIDFEHIKPLLDSISKEDSYEKKQIKIYFKKLSVGDTIKVPFSEENYRKDTTTLIRNSAYGGNSKYDFTTKCVVIEKNQHHRGFNLLCKVIECDSRKNPCVFDDVIIKTGAVFSYNMKSFKILNNWHGHFYDLNKN